MEVQHSNRGEEADSTPDETQEIILVNHFMGKQEAKYHRPRFEVFL